MKRGTFLIVNEASGETLDEKLTIPAEKCDIFQAQIYIPRSNKKMEWGLFCVSGILAQIIIYALMSYFFSWGYLALIPIEVAFMAMYGKEHVWLLKLQMVYLGFQLLINTIFLLATLLPENTGTRQDLQFLLPSLDTKTMVLYGVFFGFTTALRLILTSQYYINLYFSNLRDKFLDTKVILQPVM